MPTKNRAVRVAAIRFETALREPDAAPKCEGEWDVWADYDEENIPSAEEARALCEGCPMFDLCQASARETKPSWGVQGGEVWLFGKINKEETS